MKQSVLFSVPLENDTIYKILGTQTMCPNYILKVLILIHKYYILLQWKSNPSWAV